jgi:hypothetical protein
MGPDRTQDLEEGLVHRVRGQPEGGQPEDADEEDVEDLGLEEDREAEGRMRLGLFEFRGRLGVAAPGFADGQDGGRAGAVPEARRPPGLCLGLFFRADLSCVSSRPTGGGLADALAGRCSSPGFLRGKISTSCLGRRHGSLPGPCRERSLSWREGIRGALHRCPSAIRRSRKLSGAGVRRRGPSRSFGGRLTGLRCRAVWSTAHVFVDLILGARVCS